jgi:hypothetical protein
VSKATVSRFTFTSTGTICDVKWPFSMAAAARF